jgi:hypothetical protein
MRGLSVSFLTVGFLLIASNDALACSCAPLGGSFLKVAPASELVIRGRVAGHTGEGATETEMEVEVLETLAGETSKSMVRISGDPGNQCRPYVSAFPVGTEWVFALAPAIKDAAGARAYLMNEPDKGDYALSNCGAFWLKVKDGKVHGNIDRDDEERDAVSQELPLKELRRRFEEKKKKARSQASPASHKRPLSAGNIRLADCISIFPRRVARLSRGAGGGIGQAQIPRENL